MPKILVIDDSPSALQMVEAMLVDAGYEVLPFTDGTLAVKALRRERIDLILTDIYMPDKDGLEVICEKNQICPGVPVIAMSGAAGSWNMLSVAKCLGACQIVKKPFGSAALLKAIQSALPAQAAQSGSRK
jgi:DNA-binding NtrC family response regulator